MINTNSYLCKNDEQEEERPCLLEMPVCNNSSRFFRAVCLRNVQMSREQRKANEIDCDARVNNFQYKQQNDIKLTLIITWHQPITLPRTSNHWNQSLFLLPEISNKNEWKNCKQREREREREREGERERDWLMRLTCFSSWSIWQYTGIMACDSAHAITTQQNNHLGPIVGLWSQCKYTTDLFKTTFMTEFLKPILMGLLSKCLLLLPEISNKKRMRELHRERERKRERERERERKRERESDWLNWPAFHLDQSDITLVSWPAIQHMISPHNKTII